MSERPILGISMGDPFGNGPEITVRALADKTIYDRCRPLVVGDKSSMEYAAKVAKKIGVADLKINAVSDAKDAKYEYGTGAHSAIMLGYDAETDEIHWFDSNMRGGKKNGIRYGIVQFDEVKSVEWWASAFCHKGRGATLYRLRDDIIYAE